MILMQVLVLMLSLPGSFSENLSDKPFQSETEEEMFETRLQELFDSYFKDGNITSLKGSLEEIPMPLLFRRMRVETLQNALICKTCKASLSSLITARRLGGANRSIIYGFISTICIELRIETAEVCNGVIDRLLDTALYIVDNDQTVSGQWICSLVLQSRGCLQPPEKDWTINVDEGFSKAIADSSTTETMRILHITDFHLDEYYLPGSNSQCDKPICCSIDDGVPNNVEAEAGYWGDYRNCDTPLYTIINAFNNVKKHENISLIYFTGDIIDHRVWKTKKENNIKTVQNMHQVIDNSFPNYQIYPILGNHEPHPINLFSPTNIDPKFSVQWLFDLVAEEWSRWLPPSTKETILKGGYYTVKVTEKFRIVALNSNVCYVLNLWLLYQYKDMYGQLEWLKDVLANAEENGEYVHILSHVPTGSSECYTTWAREFRKIINRYANNIQGIFNGHTHTNEFQLFFNLSDSSQAIALAVNGGSLTTYSQLNSNYLVYTTNSETQEIIDVDHFTFNLTEANHFGANKEPNWYKLYSFKNAYNLENMKLETISDLVRRMAENNSLAKQYYTFKHKNSDHFVEKDCDAECISDNLCEVVTSLYFDTTQCQPLRDTVENSLKR